MAQMMFHRIVRLSLCVRAAIRTGQSKSWGIKYKMDFKFDRLQRQFGHDPWQFFGKGLGHGHNFFCK